MAGVELPPLIETCVQHALMKGTLFSSMNLLPPPRFPKRGIQNQDDCTTAAAPHHRYWNQGMCFNAKHEQYFPANNNFQFINYSLAIRPFTQRMETPRAVEHIASVPNKAVKRKRIDFTDLCSDQKRQIRIILTDSTAREIYEKRPAANQDGKSTKSGTALSQELGLKYGVSSKTVRDIWSRTTWTEATRELWTANELEAHLNDVSKKNVANATSTADSART
eukprot:CAMPEP_0113705400 /NCGR_PEP_ID=MMETSP0038_2-20120614/27114_1 /TAXON_ID=2898 /ORGANISM="Cryptomonas paramecium" /LENGTH=221 /DNA_ID=CAMNT_0000630409 /DNA_START=46 /DNA_END=711 /DNA_ORIENTATION=+ /assembly_acc=CAM_ASM_000170